MDPEMQAFMNERRQFYQSQGYSPQELRAALDEDSANYWRQKQGGSGGRKPRLDPMPPDYTAPPPSGSMRGQPAPVEGGDNVGDTYYGQVWRHEQDNNGSRDRRTAQGGPMDPFRKFMDGLDYQANQQGLRGGQRKQFMADNIQAFRDKMYDDLEQRMMMLQERAAMYEADGVGEELQAMDDPEMNPPGAPGYTREMNMNYSRGAPGGADIARNDARNRGVDEQYFANADRTLGHPKTQGFAKRAGQIMNQRRDAEMLSNAVNTYNGQPIPYDDFGTGEMLTRLRAKKRPGGLIGGSGPR